MLLVVLSVVFTAGHASFSSGAHGVTHLSLSRGEFYHLASHPLLWRRCPREVSTPPISRRPTQRVWRSPDHAAVLPSGLRKQNTMKSAGKTMASIPRIARVIQHSLGNGTNVLPSGIADRQTDDHSYCSDISHHRLTTLMHSSLVRQPMMIRKSVIRYPRQVSWQDGHRRLYLTDPHDPLG